MEMKIPGIFFLLILISLSFSGCVQPGSPPDIYNNSLSEAHTNPGMFDSTYYGISFRYPEAWNLTIEDTHDKVDRMRESEDVNSIRINYTNATTRFSFFISCSRVDLDPRNYPENFTGSEDCGCGWADDRFNLTVSEAYNPVTIDGGKALRTIFVIHDPDIETVETYYDICRAYKSGKSMNYRIFWSTPSGRFYDYKPVVQEILDSMRIYEPS
ncbi:MAG: hypothetical protein WC502_08435 [Methanolinea sp.]|jgi:hypothetical protein